MLKRQSGRYTLILALVGVVVAVLVGYVCRNMQTTYQENLPYVTLGDNLKVKTTKAHLYFEEAMAGDNSIDFEKDVIALLNSSSDILQNAYDGKETNLGTFTHTDEEAKAMLKDGIIGIENLKLAAQKRWDFKKESASAEVVTDSTGAVIDTGEDAGGALDQEFDASFEELQLTFDKLITFVNEKVKSDTEFLTILGWIAVTLVVLIFAGLSFFVYRTLRRNEKATIHSQLKLEEETQRVEKLSTFIEAVSTGNYSIEIDSSDELSNKLIAMRDTLRSNADEDQRRNWATSGLAQIGEILRSSSNTKELYDSIIKFVVKYTKSNQGGLFLLNDDNERDDYLELVSCYAFERKKFIQKRIELGQGLIGQCYLEGARIHLKKIPDNYVHITSGLGGTNPNSLLVIPMKVNEKTYGVIELASFQQYAEHEIVLVEKFADSIASAVSSVKINDSTRVLLEKTQQQAEEMRSQEEEMRQNMEELSATQEEMLRKEREYINRIQQLEEREGATSRA